MCIKTNYFFLIPLFLTGSMGLYPCIPEAPAKVTKPLKDKKVKEEETATFECELSKPVKEVTWLRNGEPLSPDDRVKVTSDGKKHTLTIDKAIVDDATKYTIKIGDVESSAKLTVEGTWGVGYPL